MRVLLIAAMVIGVAVGVASQEVVRIDVSAIHDFVDLKEIQIKTYDLIYHGYDQGGELEKTLTDLVKKGFSEKGLVYVDENPDAFLQVLVWSASDPNLQRHTSDNSADWPNIVRGEIESNFSVKVPKPEEDDELPFNDTKYIQLFLVKSPHSDSPFGLIWTAHAFYRGKEADIPSLAPAMIQQLLLEYPEASKLPKSREVTLIKH